MKSLLVDALRQADEKAAEEASVASSESAPPDLPLPAAGLDDLGTDELGLLETRSGMSPARELAQELPDASIQLEPASADTDDDNRPFAATMLPDANGAIVSRKPSIFESAARLTPVLCLAAMTISAAGYVLVNHLLSDDLNGGIGNPPGRTELQAVASSGSLRWQDLPVTDVSVVKLAEERNEQPRAPGQDAVAKRDDTASGKPAPQISTSAVVNQSYGDDIQIGVTRNVNSVVDDKAYSEVRAAFGAYQTRDYPVAETHYLQALKIAPYHADALAGLAAVYQQTERPDLAADTYQKLLESDPRNTLAAAALISLRSKDASWETESDLKHLLQKFPQAHHLHFALGSYFVEQSRWADARLEFLAAYELAPNNADYSFNAAVSMENLGEYGDARVYYEKALETADDSSNVDSAAVLQHLSVNLAQAGERP